MKTCFNRDDVTLRKCLVLFFANLCLLLLAICPPEQLDNCPLHFLAVTYRTYDGASQHNRDPLLVLALKKRLQNVLGWRTVKVKDLINSAVDAVLYV